MQKWNLMEKILPPKDQHFFALFEEGVTTCCKAANLFDESVKQGFQNKHLIESKEIKHKSSDIVHNTLSRLNLTFVTPLEREDIQIVATLLDKITRRTIRACINLSVYKLDFSNDHMKNQAETLKQATNELSYIVNHLKAIKNLNEITESHRRMKAIESHGDEILYSAMKELFSGKYETLTVLKLRDIYHNIENALDTCFNVSDTIVNIVLKQT